MIRTKHLFRNTFQELLGGGRIMKDFVFLTAGPLMVLALLGSMFGISSLSGQQQTSGIHVDVLSPTELLALISSNDRGTRMGARMGITAFFQSDPPSEDLDALLQGLADVAVHHPVLAIQQAAVSSIDDLADVGRSQDQSRSLPKLFQIIEGSRELRIQRIALLSVGRMPPEDKSLTFLKNVATAEETNHRSLAFFAIDALSAMGREGPAVLRDIYEGGLVRDPQAAGHLQALAKQGFRKGGG